MPLEKESEIYQLHLQNLGLKQRCNDDDLVFDLLSSHTARRSFATNYYLLGFPTIDLMKITGHRTERSFLKYIKVSKLDTAKRLSEHIKDNWSKKLLSVK